MAYPTRLMGTWTATTRPKTPAVSRTLIFQIGRRRLIGRLSRGTSPSAAPARVRLAHRVQGRNTQPADVQPLSAGWVCLSQRRRVGDQVGPDGQLAARRDHPERAVVHSQLAVWRGRGRFDL